MTSRQARRRWFGAFYLALAATLLIWGQTYLSPYLGGLSFMLYWLACFVFTLMAMIIAFLDLRTVRQQLRQQQQGLIEKTLRDAGLPKDSSRSQTGATPGPPLPPAANSTNHSADPTHSHE